MDGTKNKRQKFLWQTAKPDTKIFFLFQQDWQRKNRSPGDLLQIHVLREKMKDLKELLDQLQYYTKVIAEEDFDPESHEDLADEVERRSRANSRLTPTFVATLSSSF